MEIQGSRCYTRESGAASILSGEPYVPGKIPGGVASGSIPEFRGFDPGGVPTVPGKIPVGMTSHPTPVGQQSGVVSLISSFIPGQVVVFVYSREANPYSHQRPCGDERFGGRKTSVERLRRRLRD